MKVLVIAKCRLSDNACDSPIHLEAFRSIYTDSESIKKMKDILGQSEWYARLNCLHGAKSSPLAEIHLK